LTKPDKTDQILRSLIDLCGELSRGKYRHAQALFELTKEGTYPPLVARLAESFGMMMVQVEAREYGLEGTIERLRADEAELARAQERLAQENSRLKQTLKQHFSPVRIIGQSPQMAALIHQVRKVADTPVNVLVTGETGTGKELIAKTIHYTSGRSEKPFVALNCSAIPETIFESEMFGIEKGVATGVAMRIGKIEQANGGTLVFDEIGDMPLSSQAKILRVIEDRLVDKVGGRKPMAVDIRVVAATNRDLKEAVHKGAFREDLYYRLNVIRLPVPPLRERQGDIALLAKFFLDQSVRKLGSPPLGLSPEAMRLLEGYAWPGNVRELENEMERAVALATGETIAAADLSEGVRQSAPTRAAADPGTTVRQAEQRLIESTLQAAGGNKSEAARLLGMSREGLRKKLARFGREER
jgi:transcriptional regulator with PAS, ATPase and Fis domain